MSDDDCVGAIVQVLCEILCLCCLETDCCKLQCCDGCCECCNNSTPRNNTHTRTNNAGTGIPYTNVYNVQTAQPTQTYVPSAPQVSNYPTNTMLIPQQQPTAPSEEENLLGPLRFGGGVVNEAPPSYEEATKNSTATESIPKKVNWHQKEY